MNKNFVTSKSMYFCIFGEWNWPLHVES